VPGSLLAAAAAAAVAAAAAAVHAAGDHGTYVLQLQLIDNRADKLIVPRTKEERAKLSGYAAQYAAEIAELLPLIPPVLLLLLKTNDCLRAVDNALGQPANTLAITARSCTLALAQQRLLERPGWRSRLAVAVDVAAVELRVSALLALTWLRDVQRWLLPSKGSALPDSEVPASGEAAAAP
jgi:hypothetical protein